MPSKRSLKASLLINMANNPNCLQNTVRYRWKQVGATERRRSKYHGDFLRFLTFHENLMFSVRFSLKYIGNGGVCLPYTLSHRAELQNERDFFTFINQIRLFWGLSPFHAFTRSPQNVHYWRFLRLSWNDPFEWTARWPGSYQISKWKFSFNLISLFWSGWASSTHILIKIKVRFRSRKNTTFLNLHYCNRFGTKLNVL